MSDTGSNRLTEEQLLATVTEAARRPQFLMLQVMSWEWLDASKDLPQHIARTPERGVQ